MIQKCQTCGAGSSRVETKFNELGQVIDEYCVACRPEAFERHQDPSDKKLWLGWEYDAAHYKRTYDKDGPIMMPSDSVLQDLQDAACKQSEESIKSQEAERQKRARQRTLPMSEDEYRQALAMAREVAGAIEEHHATRS